MYRDILKSIHLDYERKRDEEERLKRMRTQEIYRKIPAIKRIDEDIFQIGLNMAKFIIGNPQGYKKDIEKAKEKIEKLKMEKAFLLTESNIDPSYMEKNYECKTCNDTGYLDNGNKCNCLRQKLVSRAYKMSNIETNLLKDNFKNFDINIFKEEAFENESMTPRENMIDIVGIAESFIGDFEEKNDDNLLFYGTTGLGKTFLCSCIAKALLDKDKIVVYQTAFTILEILERKRFGRDKDKTSYEYDLLFDADLLIIDDLGTEVSNTFTNAEIFNIVNTRIIKGKKTIISTNLTPKEISQIYTDRVFSRILEKFLPLKLYGDDIRWE